jgi:hypothetical protein
MKHIEIWIDAMRIEGSDNYQWVYYMSYETPNNSNENTAVIKRCGTQPQSNNAKRATLYALLHALKRINQPVEIVVHSRTPLGFKHPNKSLSSYCLGQIQAEVNAAGHVLTIDEDTSMQNFNKIIYYENKYGSQEVANMYKEKLKLKESKSNPNVVFSDANLSLQNESSASENWREMYSDLMGPSQGTWVPGSGGY